MPSQELPAGIAAEIQPPCKHDCARAHIGHVCFWVQDPARYSEPEVWILDDALVFGGTLTERATNTHRSGQLLLTRELEIIDPSYGITDGDRSLSGDRLAEGADGTPSVSWPYPRPGTTMSRLRERFGLRPARRLPGTYVFLGGVHPHFGHFLLEGLSRLWISEYLGSDLTSDVRFLIYEPSLPPFAERIFERAGIGVDRIVFASALDRVERLIVPEPGMRTHRWVSSHMAHTWRRIAGESAVADPGRRIYLSRRAFENRGLANEAEVERAFVAAGYEVVQPETMTIDEQIAMAAQASHLAGPTGSQLYLAAFQAPGAHTLVMAPDNFFLKDDLLVADAGGRRLSVAFGSGLDLRAHKRKRAWTIESTAVAELITDSRG